MNEKAEGFLSPSGAKLKSLLGGDYNQTVIWAVAFVGVSVLVGIGKMPSSAIENLLFAMFGAAASNRLTKGSSEAKAGG